MGIGYYMFKSFRFFLASGIFSPCSCSRGESRERRKVRCLIFIWYCTYFFYDVSARKWREIFSELRLGIVSILFSSTYEASVMVYAGMGFTFSNNPNNWNTWSIVRTEGKNREPYYPLYKNISELEEAIVHLTVVNRRTLPQNVTVPQRDIHNISPPKAHIFHSRLWSGLLFPLRRFIFQHQDWIWVLSIYDGSQSSRKG